MPAPHETSHSVDPFRAVQNAAGFAARAHRNQFRNDEKTPYVAHVFRVAMTVRHVFGCEDPTAITAALLHDTIEDTTTDYEDIAVRFGSEVASMVAALTKNMALPKESRETEYEQRLAAADWRVRLIKLADTYDNLIDSSSGHQPKSDGESKHIKRCRVAMALVGADAAARPVAARAVAIVQSEIDRTNK